MDNKINPNRFDAIKHPIWEQHVEPDGCFGHNRRIIINTHIGIDMLAIPDGRVSEKSFPPQNDYMIGKEFLLMYKYEDIDASLNTKEIIVENPALFYRTGLFRVIRWDMDKPFCILVNDNIQAVIVTVPTEVQYDGTKYLDSQNREVSNRHVHQIPVQNYDFLGLQTMDCYFDSVPNEFHYSGIIIRADTGGSNPKCIILEERNDEYKVVSIHEGMFYIQPTDIGCQENPIKKDFWPTDWRNLK